MERNEVARVADIKKGRTAFAITSLRRQIYVIGGTEMDPTRHDEVRQTERYNIERGQWEDYGEVLPFYLVAPAALKF